jgi:hypothetical protein
MWKIRTLNVSQSLPHDFSSRLFIESQFCTRMIYISLILALYLFLLKGHAIQFKKMKLTILFERITFQSPHSIPKEKLSKKLNLGHPESSPRDLACFPKTQLSVYHYSSTN